MADEKRVATKQAGAGAPAAAANGTTARPASAVTEEELAFKLRGGMSSLYLVETLGEWTGRRYERIYDAARWQQWLALAGLPEPARVATARDLRTMRALRAAIHAAARAALTGDATPPGAIDMINRCARRPMAVPQLSPAGDAWAIPAAVTHAQVLAIIALDAIALLGGPLRARIRECARPRCPVLFVDRSRHGRRVWCSPACGARRASARYRLRLAGRELAEADDGCGPMH